MRSILARQNPGSNLSKELTFKYCQIESPVVFDSKLNGPLFCRQFKVIGKLKLLWVEKRYTKKFIAGLLALGKESTDNMNNLTNWDRIFLIFMIDINFENFVKFCNMLDIENCYNP